MLNSLMCVSGVDKPILHWHSCIHVAALHASYKKVKGVKNSRNEKMK